MLCFEFLKQSSLTVLAACMSYREAELLDEVLDAELLVRCGDGGAEAEVGGEHERLVDGEHGEQAVVLHDVGRGALDEAGAHLDAVERHAAVEAGDAPGERVQERGLAGAAGAHDGRDAPLGSVPGDLMQQVHVLLLPLPAGAALLLDDRVRKAGELQPAREAEPPHARWLLRLLRHVDHRLQAVAAVPAIVLMVMVMRHALHVRTHRCGRLWVLFLGAQLVYLQAYKSVTLLSACHCQLRYFCPVGRCLAPGDGNEDGQRSVIGVNVCCGQFLVWTVDVDLGQLVLDTIMARSKQNYVLQCF